MRIALAALIFTLALGVGGISTAGQLGGVVQGVKEAGQVTKEGAKTAGEATKDGAKTVKNTVTGDAQAKCADGTTQTSKTQKAANAACKKHGGLMK